jgi:hypothetical protein
MGKWASRESVRSANGLNWYVSKQASGQMVKCKVVNYARSRVDKGVAKWASEKWAKIHVGNWVNRKLVKQVRAQMVRGKQESREMGKVFNHTSRQADNGAGKWRSVKWAR